VINFLIFVLDSVCSSSSLSSSRFAPLFFVLVRASRAGTTRVGEVRVVHGPRSWHVVLARHDTASLSCQLVSCQIVSCLVVFVSCGPSGHLYSRVHTPLLFSHTVTHKFIMQISIYSLLAYRRILATRITTTRRSSPSSPQDVFVVSQKM
jgi:hypothetical protein